MTNSPPMTKDEIEELAKRLSDHMHLMQNDGLAALIETATKSAAALLTLSAERDTLAAKVAELEGAGSKMLELWAGPGESNFEAFERIAHTFYRETGVMAPGKDAPAGSSQGEPEERRAKYNLWMERRVAAFRGAIARTQAPTEGGKLL